MVAIVLILGLLGGCNLLSGNNQEISKGPDIMDRVRSLDLLPRFPEQAASTDQNAGARAKSQVYTGVTLAPIQGSRSQPGAGVGGKGVLIEILGPMGSKTPVDRFNTVKMPVPRIVKTPVSGLGDDAVYVETSGAALYVKKGDFVFQIRVHGFPLEEIKAKEKTLAVDVMAKL